MANAFKNALGSLFMDEAQEWTADCKMLLIGAFAYVWNGIAYDSRPDGISDNEWRDVRNDRTTRFYTHVSETQVPLQIAKLEQKAIDAIHTVNDLSLTDEEQAEKAKARKALRDREALNVKSLAAVSAGKITAEAQKTMMENYDSVQEILTA